MTIRQLDPERVAALPDDLYSCFLAGLTFALNHSREEDIPEHIYVLTYRTANDCGARVRSYDDLRRIAAQFRHRRLTIERLRRFR